MKLIELTEDHLDEAVKLYQDTFSKEPWFDDDSDESVRNLLINHMNNNYYLGYGLIKEDVLVGLSIGFKKPWIKGIEYYVDQFVISYHYQHQGLGTIFLEFIENDLKKQDINAMILNTEKGYPAEEFYIKNGFKILDGIIVLGK